MIFLTWGNSLSGSGRDNCLALTVMLPLMLISGLTKVRMAVSEAFTTERIKGSFGLSKRREKVTFIPSMRMLSSTMPNDTMSFPLPG